MKFLSTSILAMALFSFQHFAYAEEVNVMKLDERAVAEEAQNPETLQPAETLDLQLGADDQFNADIGNSLRKPRIVRTCFAKNARGELYRASGIFVSLNDLQRKAMRACRADSRFPRSCHKLGCR